MPQGNYRKRSESTVVRSLCDWLYLAGYKVWRQNNIAVYDPVKKCFRSMPKHCKKGVPDIFVLDGSRTWGIEAKTDKGKLTKSQKIFRDFWTLHPYRYYEVARSEDDLKRLGFHEKTKN